jgi:hypothetical protein
MSMPQKIVHIDVSDVIRLLEDIGHEVETYPMDLIAAGLVGAVDDVITTEGSGSWEPLSPSTLRRRPRRAGGSLLQDRGFLADIMTAHGPDWAEAASLATYAGFHVTGTKHMPARDWTDIDLETVLDEFTDQIMEEAVTP